MALRDTGRRLASMYDRFMAVAVLLGLVGSLSYLGWHAGYERVAQMQFVKSINSLTIAHPEADVVDASAYEAALEAVRRPHEVDAGSWSNKLFVPEVRVWCMECRMPHPYDAAVCPFCGSMPRTRPGPDRNRDLDGDGMKDEWEIAHGLDPANAADAGLDPDGDGYTNREEHDAVPQTLPFNRESSPPVVYKLCVERIAAQPFRLLFKSSIRLPDGSRKFFINDIVSGQTYHKRLGETVEGFTIEDFEPVSTKMDVNGVMKTVDLSILTLKRGDKAIRLQMGRNVQYTEYRARLYFAATESYFTLKKGDSFKLLDKPYRLMTIDSSRRRVVIRRMQDGMDFNVGECGERERADGDPGSDRADEDRGEMSL